MKSVPEREGKRLTAKDGELHAEWYSRYDGGNCSCHISPPCGSCTHPGNPYCLEATDEYWEFDSDIAHREWLDGLEAEAICNFHIWLDTTVYLAKLEIHREFTASYEAICIINDRAPTTFFASSAAIAARLRILAASSAGSHAETVRPRNATDAGKACSPLGFDTIPIGSGEWPARYP